MPTISGISTGFFPVNSETYSSTLSSSIGAGVATVPVASATAYIDGDYVALTVDAGTVKQATFHGTKSGSSFVNCVWTEGNLGVGHDAGATIADWDSATHFAVLGKGARVAHDQDGTLKAGAVDNAAVLASDVVTTAKILNSNVTGEKIPTDAHIIGYTEVATGFSTASTTFTDVTSLSVSLTTPVSCTRILLRAEATISNTVATATGTLAITDSGNVVQVQRTNITGQANVNALQSISISRRIGVAPSTAYTFKLRISTSSGTVALNQGDTAASPTMIWVERA